MEPKLIIFDIDGTIAKSWTDELLPGVARFFDLVFHNGCRNRPRIALATNQGGVGLRCWMETDEWGNPEDLPTQADAESRCNAIAASLAGAAPLPLYISFTYQAKNGKWAPTPPEGRNDARWSPNWRKPAPGMLIQAMRDAGVTPAETLMIGDRPEDQQAAAAAGCSFIWAQKFFARGWEKGQDYGLLFR